MNAQLRPWAEYTIQLGRAYGLNPRVTSVFRSWAEQNRLFQAHARCVADGRFPGPGCRFPANRPGDSSHNFGLSFDSSVPAETQALWDEIRRFVGWGVPANDRIHAEVPGWRQLR